MKQRFLRLDDFRLNARHSKSHYNRPPSRGELVAAGFRYQNAGIGRVSLDLLAQPVDMCFECMGRNIGVITPDFCEKDITPYDLASGTVEIPQNGCLFLGQLHFRTFVVQKQL